MEQMDSMQSEAQFEFESLILFPMTITVTLSVPLLIASLSNYSFYKDGFGIRQPTKIDMPSNQETK